MVAATPVSAAKKALKKFATKSDTICPSTTARNRGTPAPRFRCCGGRSTDAKAAAATAVVASAATALKPLNLVYALELNHNEPSVDPGLRSAYARVARPAS